MLARLHRGIKGYILTYQLEPDGQAYQARYFDWETNDTTVRVYDMNTNETIVEYDTQAETGQDFAIDMAKAIDKVRSKYEKA